MSIESLTDSLVRLASQLVPHWRRADWQREWRAELHSYALDEPSAARRLVRAAAALVDAIWLRIQAVELGLWTGELRFACRRLVRRPGFTLLVTLTFAIGAGVGGAVFAIVDGVLLRPLPYKDPSRLVFVWQTLPSQNAFEIDATPFDYQLWKSARSFASLAILSPESVTVTGTGGDPERLHASRVSASMFPLLGIAPRIGRAFDASEDVSAAAPVVLLGDGIWRRRFASDPAVVGRAIELDGIPTTVVGVMPPQTFLPGPFAGNDELWLPMRMTSAEQSDQIGHNYPVVGRLVDGVSLDQARAEMIGIAAASTAAHADTHRSIGIRLVSVPEQTVGTIRPALLVLTGGVALLLAIASANVVTLLLARAASRRQELAVLAALGAGRSRIASIAVAEAVLLAVVGGLGGVTVADWALAALPEAFADALPPAVQIAVDARVAMVTIAAAVLLGVVFGIIVAAHRPTVGVGDSLRSGSRSSASREVTRTRNVLVVSQVALAMILLAGSGMMVRSFVRLSHVQPGFVPERVLTFRIALPAATYPIAEGCASFVRDLIDRLSALRGVMTVGVNTRIPFGLSRGANGFAIEGQPSAPGELLIADQREVSPAYFRAMGIRILQGTSFSARDDARGEPVAMVNQTMSRRFWPDRSPIGARVRVTFGEEESAWLRVVGVVDDVHHVDLSRQPVPELYRPFAQMPLRNFTVVVRTAGDPAAVAPLARAAIGSLDRRLPLYDMRTMESRIADSVAKTRALALLLLVTAVVAAAFAGVAIYGSIWYSVTERVFEIGVRLALGATRRSVCALVLGRALTMTAIGAAIGIGGSVAIAPLLRGLLFETPPVDLPTYMVVLGSLALLTIAASLVPARRAMSVDPLTALRSD